MEKPGKLKFVIITLLVFFVLSFLLAGIASFLISVPFGNIALIPITGTIVSEETSSFGEKMSSSKEIVDYIEEADKDPSIKAIVFEINSPGGSAVASKEIVDAIKRTNKPTYSLIREIGTSGAYWVSSATGKSIANELSVTGSIGVISSYIEFSGLLNKYNITYQRLISGKYKDIGSPLKPLQKDEEEILISKLNKIHDYFIRSVAENRKMPVEKVTELATGEFFLGSEAKDNGLIDYLGDKETLKEMLKQDLNITEIEFAEYERTPTLVDILSGVLSKYSFNVGQGIGSSLKENTNTNKISITT